jgi:hypothetical protein
VGATEPFAGWDDALRAELDANTSNPAVGTTLLLEDERARSLPLATTAVW